MILFIIIILITYRWYFWFNFFLLNFLTFSWIDKPIVLIKVLSGEQMYQEVSSSSNSNINNNYGYNTNVSSSNIDNNGKNQQKSYSNHSDQPTTTTTTMMEHYYRFNEMSEIFFNCSINSNPDAHRIEWFMNEKLIHTNIPKGKNFILCLFIVFLSKIIHCPESNSIYINWFEKLFKSQSKSKSFLFSF